MVSDLRTAMFEIYVQMLYPEPERMARHREVRRLMEVASGCMGHDENEAAYLLEKAAARLRQK